MRKLKTLVAVLMLVFILGLSAPQALAGQIDTPLAPGETQGPSITEPQEAPGDVQAGADIHTPGITGEIPTGGFATWAKILFQIFG